MQTIGTFTKSGDGAYSGAIKTLNLNIKNVQLRPAEKETDKAPDFRLIASGVEIGAAWKKTSRSKRDYLSVTLDDPSFSAPVYANLVDADDGFSLVWARNRTAH
jgi:uncharacterized protein (DUF736 family)